MSSLDPLTWQTALSTWSVAPGWDAVVLAMAAAYLLGLRGARRAGGHWPAGRTAGFFLGLLTIVLAVNTAIGVHSHVLFWVHMIQHLMLVMVAPVLLIVGHPLTLWVRAAAPAARQRRERLLRSRTVTALTHPVGTFVLYGVVLVGTHLTQFMQAMLLNMWLHHLEIALYLVSGYLCFLPVVGAEPTRWQRFAHPLRLLLLFMGMLPDTVIGVVLMTADHPLFPAYGNLRDGWGMDPLADQRLGGAIMWVVGDGLMAALIIIVVAMWMRSSGSESGFGEWLESARRGALARTDHTSSGPSSAVHESDDVDADDRALAEYNAMLARLDENERRRSR